MQTFTTQDIAEKFGVSGAAVRAWCSRQLFPNARLIETPRGPYWEIPASDVAGFTPPPQGRPRTIVRAAPNPAKGKQR